MRARAIATCRERATRPTEVTDIKVWARITTLAYGHCGSVALAGFPDGSLFYGHDITERVHVEWGTFSLVAAFKALLRSALQDPLNLKFLLISESGIPLYPPELMWVQLMIEEKSRINACKEGKVRIGA
jgi:hypothetical protein